MSKKKKTAKAVKKGNTKKRASKKPLIITIVVIALIAAAVTAAVIFSVNAPESLAKTSWISVSATNSADEAVDLKTIYNNYYSNYQGTLEFSDDGKFELWLTTGEPADGSHSGTYEVDGDTVRVKYEGGDSSEFRLERDGTKIKSILVNYGEYKVNFERQKAAEK